MEKYYRKTALFGILMSILWVLLVNTQPFSDFAYYDELAGQIAYGGPWGDTYTSVGYPIVLGLVYRIFGSSPAAAKIFNLALTFINYILFYKILKKADLSEKRRKFIYALFVVFPSNIFYNSILAGEILFTTILLLITFLYFYDVKYKYILIGVLTAAGAMVKPFFLGVFFLIFIVELCFKMKFGVVLKHSLIVFTISAVVISPWLYRNTRLMGQSTFISNNGGIVLYINNNSQNRYGMWMDARDVDNSIVKKTEYVNANATEKNKMLSNAAWKWIGAHPAKFVQLGFKRLFITYIGFSEIDYSFNGVDINPIFKFIFSFYAYAARYVVFIPALIMLLIYSVRTIRGFSDKKPVDHYLIYNLVCFYMFALVYFISEGQPRYSFPCTFIMIYFFSYFVDKNSYVKFMRKIGLQKML
ncbi:hypothetical protein [Clostridium luticellarii]|uniref:Glycosyltransferase RgtA/B/C/D-like domain-containing protein n=1 Tax=Clostridium luticellarii TaxID=1691940 RepID=A0A2T0BJZ9_9CLOT|nr:hypothetical protein [Clostridium luticellarii]MCI1969458.1 hypothetical protein [Clostridium luticellarii]MCI1996774.1 hypothetical protein [Clostridium luticellarii]MCI2039625.1 hypothetical protein [Clostridium luticellarii]PRR84204.1 hypothetical protein CLLU_24640 [Clostridium luticellarii]